MVALFFADFAVEIIALVQLILSVAKPPLLGPDSHTLILRGGNHHYFVERLSLSSLQ